MRRNLNFRENNKIESEADEFLKRCPSRSITTLCAIAINDMVKTFHLENASKEEVAKFIDFHDFLSVSSENRQVSLPPASHSEKAEKKTVQPKTKQLVSNEAKNVMNDVMASLLTG